MDAVDQPHRLDRRWGTAAVILSVLVTYFVSGGWKADWAAPLSYGADALFSLQLIQRMNEGGWLFDTTRQGFPYAVNLLDFPSSDLGLHLLLKLLGLVLQDAGLTFNVFFVMGFAASAASAYVVLSKLGLGPRLSFAGALLFALAPYHFARLDHVMLSWYAVVPLYFWLAWKVAGLAGNCPPVRRRDMALAFVCGFFGIYYAFFGAVLLCIASLAKAMRSGSLKSWGRSGPILVASTLLAVVINVSPTLVNNAVNGKNTEVVKRFPNETEVYGIKLAQLILPPEEHRIRLLGKTTGHYNDDFPLVNENTMSALGAVGAAGLVLMLWTVLRNNVAGADDPVMALLAFMTLCLLLLCTIGGFSTFFSMFVTPSIRAWNRASVFLQFACLAAVMWSLSRRRSSRLHRWPAAAFCGLVVAVAVIDQTPRNFSRTARESARDYRADERFFSEVEKNLPAGSAVLQLPYVFFPEGPPTFKMEAYDPAKPFLHTQTLRWSWGGVKGRAADRAYRALVEREMDTMLAQARRAGYRGLLIDRFGYADAGRAVEKELWLLLGVLPQVSADSRWAFYRL